VIDFLPFNNETLVVAKEWPEVLNRLSMATLSLNSNEINTDAVFYGWVKADRFRFSLKTRRPNSFIPLIIGTIEPTSTGCIIFLEYKFFPVTKMYLIFWSLFIMLSGVVIAHQYNKIYLGLLCVGLVFLINWIAWANFKLQKDLSRKALLKILQ
jgi:hypothetical protein